MTKHGVSVLIIDDERERTEIYRDFFARLSADSKLYYSVSPLVPESPSEALSILDSRDPCLVILDVVLTGEWLTNSSLIYSRIRALGYPIVLLSGRFEEQGADHKATSVLAELKSIPKLGFLPYTSSIRSHVRSVAGTEVERLPDDTLGMWNYMLAEALGHATNWSPAREGEVGFLHITDTHFGPDVAPDYLNVFAIGNGAHDHNGSLLHADVVLWTGDITDNGYPHEFELAFQFARDLQEADFVTKPCLFSIAPGNHDCCWPLALSSRLQRIEKPAKRGNKAQDTNSGNWEWQLSDSTVNEELWSFSLTPYQRFYSQLIGESIDRKTFNWRPHWKQIGFAILELPIEGHLVLNRKNQDPMPSPFVSDQDFKSTTNQALAEISKSHLDPSVCILVLIHGRDPDDQQNTGRWNDFLVQLGRMGNPLIVLGGHEHLNDHAYNANRLTVIGSPFDSSKVESGRTLPSVRFMKLSNLLQTKLTCDITSLEKYAGDGNATEWRQGAFRRFEINPVNRHWQDMTNTKSSAS